ILITDQNSAPLLPLLLERVGVRRFKKPNFDVQTVNALKLTEKTIRYREHEGCKENSSIPSTH
ncbi:MAG: hypothetical protein WAW41_01520, partial [Methylobacter sp.]